MFVKPRYQPVIEGLNSYYLDVRKFYEHYQREVGAFGIHLQSRLVEGIAYLDSGQLIGAAYASNGACATGMDAVESLFTAAEKHNLSVNLYRIEPEVVFFWADALQATSMHRDLTTAITDLDRLIANTKNQHLTGFIEVILGDHSGSGILFFKNGEIAWACTDSNGKRESVEAVCHFLKEATQAKGGTFHISRTDTPPATPPSKNAAAAAAGDPSPGNNMPIAAPKTKNLLPMLEEILCLSESVFTESKQRRDFQTHFRKAAIELADNYSFLDPFVKEFEFSAGRVQLHDHVEPQELVAGVLECIQKVLKPLGLAGRFREKAESWFRENSETLKRLGLKK
jgi:hypothetical protein